MAAHDLVMASAGGGASLPANIGVTWTAASGQLMNGEATPTTGKSMFKVIWDGSRYVAGGGYYRGNVYTSTDGLTWTWKPGMLDAWAYTTGSNDMRVFASNGSQSGYMVSSYYGRVATSPDLETWTDRTSAWGLTFGIQALIYGNGVWIAGSSTGIIFTSPDGAAWTQRFTFSSGRQIYDIVNIGSKYVCCAGGAAGQPGIIATSTDGLTWTNANVTFPANSTFAKMAWNGSILVGVGGFAGKSTDGVNWTFNTGYAANSVVWDGSKFLALNGQVLSTSTDGLNWSTATTFTGLGGASTIQYANGKYFINQFTDANNYEAYKVSTDGVNWSDRYWCYPYWDNYGGIGKYYNNSIYAFSSTFGTYAVSSDLGQTWTPSTAIGDLVSWGVNQPITGVGSSGSTIVVVGTKGRCATSTNGGATWTYQAGLVTAGASTNASSVFYGVVHNGSIFLAFGTLSQVLTSPDGVTWTNRTSSLTSTTFGAENILCGVWTGSQFVIGGSNGKVATSPDGITWTHRSTLSSTTWGTTWCRCIAWNGSRILMLGDSSKAATSTDGGATWTYQSGLSTTNWSTNNSASSLAVVGSTFFAGSTSGVGLAWSSDGVTWSYSPNYYTAFGTYSNVQSLIWTGAKLVVLATNSGFGVKKTVFVSP